MILWPEVANDLTSGSPHFPGKTVADRFRYPSAICAEKSIISILPEAHTLRKTLDDAGLCRFGLRLHLRGGDIYLIQFTRILIGVLCGLLFAFRLCHQHSVDFVTHCSHFVIGHRFIG